MEKKIAIIILSYNTRKLIQQCLNSIFAAVKSNPSAERAGLPISNIEIIIVDNNSTDGSREYLEKLESKFKFRPEGGQSLTEKEIESKRLKLKVFFNKKNLGFTGGNNVGIRYALSNDANYIMLLNNDVLIKDIFWQPLIVFLENNPQVGVVGPKIYFAPGYEFHKDRYSSKERGRVIWYAGGEIDWNNIVARHRGVDEVDQGQYDQPKETEFVSGCCLLARREVWQEVGLLDEKYFLYYEDSDFCLRAKKKGWEIYYLPQAKIWHLNAGSSKVGGSLQDYFITRNRLLFGFRWAPFKTKQALFRESLRTLLKGRKWQKIGVRDFYLRRFGKGSWRFPSPSV